VKVGGDDEGWRTWLEGAKRERESERELQGDK
jgi:hypothetical protein